MSAKKRRKKSASDEAEQAAGELKEESGEESPEEQSPGKEDPEGAEAIPAEPEESPPEAGVPRRVVHCPVCEGSGEEHMKQGNLTVCRCADCGLLFQNPRPAAGLVAEVRDRLFEDAIVKPHGPEIREQAEIAREIMKAYHHRTSGRPVVLNAFGKHVLEVNCEHGFRLREFQKYGWTIQGIDSSRNAVEYAKACMLDVEQGWLETAAFETGTFDLVVFRNTFGDIPDPVHAVHMLAEILKERGLVYVHLEKSTEQPFRETDFFYYDPESLRRVFMQNGFTVVLENNDESGYFFWFKRKERSVTNASEKS